MIYFSFQCFLILPFSPLVYSFLSFNFALFNSTYHVFSYFLFFIQYNTITRLPQDGYGMGQIGGGGHQDTGKYLSYQKNLMGRALGFRPTAQACRAFQKLSRQEKDLQAQTTTMGVSSLQTCHEASVVLPWHRLNRLSPLLTLARLFMT